MIARKRNKSILRFYLFLLGCMLAHTASIHAQPSTRHYPPYPDVWQWVIPQAYEHDSIVNLYALPTGDYVISSSWWEPVDRPRAERTTIRFACRTLFAQEQTMQEACVALERSHRGVEHTEKIQFRDGTTIERGGFIPPYCYGGLSPTLVIKNPQGEVIAEKVFLVIRDTPRRYEESGRCGDDEDFDEKIVALFANFVLLADETFLLFDFNAFGYGSDKEFSFLLRFDKQLRTRATLLGQKIFLVDSVTLNNIMNSTTIQNNISVQGEYRTYQRINEALLKYLSELKGKE